MVAHTNSIARMYDKIPSASSPDASERLAAEIASNLTRKLPGVCGRWTARLIESGVRTHLFRVNCKLWKCPRCGTRKAARYKHRIREVAEEYRLQRFVTLTVDPKKIGDQEPVPYLRDCWSKLRVYLKREFGLAPKYICVLEFQKNGNPHLHILVDRFISQAWLKDTWQRIGGGEHVDIRHVDLHRVARYLSKYLTKELLLSAPLRSRRVTTSHGIHLNPKKDDNSADLLKIPISSLFERFWEYASSKKYDEDGVTLQMFVCEKLII
jgi:hypothetical protein